METVEYFAILRHFICYDICVWFRKLVFLNMFSNMFLRLLMIVCIYFLHQKINIYIYIYIMIYLQIFCHQFSQINLRIFNIWWIIRIDNILADMEVLYYLCRVLLIMLLRLFYDRISHYDQDCLFEVFLIITLYLPSWRNDEV